MSAVDNDNPFWDQIGQHVHVGDDILQSGRTIGSWREIEWWAKRRGYCRTFAWAVPSPEMLDWMVERIDGRTLVEIGAGTGYWAWQLQQLGVHVRAYDIAPPGRMTSNNQWHTPRDDDGNATDTGEQYFPVKYGGPHYAGMWPEAVLFLCWPPYDDAMAYDCLSNFHGKELIYCGERDGGCTGTDEFHELLWKDFELVETAPGHVQWPGIHDEVQLWWRRHD